MFILIFVSSHLFDFFAVFDGVYLLYSVFIIYKYIYYIQIISIFNISRYFVYLIYFIFLVIWLFASALLLLFEKKACFYVSKLSLYYLTPCFCPFFCVLTDFLLACGCCYVSFLLPCLAFRFCCLWFSACLVASSISIYYI